STKPLTIGRMDNVETQYALLGSVDEVKLWNVEIPASQIEQLKNQWPTLAQTSDIDPIVRVYPNPVERVLNVEFNGSVRVKHISLFNANGLEVSGLQVHSQSSGLKIEIPQTCSGLHLLRITLNDGRVLSRKIIVR
ncbi:MAG: T9SS type A sorting domain-containing protein, partial [Bacteroidota bacterium]|nr:T9SS type A sorting domain-containing protein [Bacteroidota bacterium]